VFIRSLMGFSKHPGSFASSVPGADATFDRIFDAFRPDLGGTQVTSADLADGLAVLADGSSCPGSDRQSKLACAVFVLGNLIGGTLSHEIGHSLGLANPYMDGFHNAGDAPARLMDAGGDRPFLERAELEGVAPGVFCDDEYAYLRQILPSSDPEPAVQRPGCFWRVAARDAARSIVGNAFSTASSRAAVMHACCETTSSLGPVYAAAVTLRPPRPT
jgi:hypothetical protein